jgi:transposase
VDAQVLLQENLKSQPGIGLTSAATILADLVQVAKAISKTKKSSKLKRFFLMVLKRSGNKNVTAIALARKVLCITFHMLMKREDYQEPEVKKAKPKTPSCVSPISMMDIDEMIKTISRAGYLVEKELKEG